MIDKDTIKKVLNAQSQVISEIRERAEDPTDYSQQDIIDSIEEILTTYPEELTFDEFDNFGWNLEKQFGLDDDRDNSIIAKEVLEYAEKIKGQIYTQVDDNVDRIYSRGMRIVNRTGIWEVVKIEGLKVDNS